MVVFINHSFFSLCTLPAAVIELCHNTIILSIKVLFTVRYTKRQITALTFFAITKTITKKGKAEFSDFKG